MAEAGGGPRADELDRLRLALQDRDVAAAPAESAPTVAARGAG